MNLGGYGLMFKNLNEHYSKESSAKDQSLTLKRILIKILWLDDRW